MLDDEERAATGDGDPLETSDRVDVSSTSEIAEQEIPPTRCWQAASSLRLAGADSEWAARIARTCAGQATWAADDTTDTCGGCRYWDNCGKPTGPYALKRLGGCIQRPRSCSLFKTRMRRVGPPVPHDAIACRDFKPINEDTNHHE
jgi:hypothetical protein